MNAVCWFKYQMGLFLRPVQWHPETVIPILFLSHLFLMYCLS